MNPDRSNLKEMKAVIEQIEQLVHKLKTSGGGIPVVEKNARILLSIVNIL
jgi:carbamate kinase